MKSRHRIFLQSVVKATTARRPSSQHRLGVVTSKGLLFATAVTVPCSIPSARRPDRRRHA
jgi:hypothetical protein